MTAFLDDLGRELDAAAARVVEGRRPRRSPWPAISFAAVAAALAMIGVLLGGSSRPEREARVPASDAAGPFRLAPPPPELDGVDIGLAVGRGNGSFEPIFSERALRLSGWPIGADEAGNRPVATVLPVVKQAENGLTVVYGTATRAQAEAAARALEIERVQSAPPELAHAGVTIVFGVRAVFPAALAAYRRDYAVLRPDGAGRAGHARVQVEGADLCVSASIGETSGETCSFSEEVWRNVLTIESGKAYVAAGVVPDGVDHVTLSTGEDVPVRDNVWTVGRTGATYAEVPGFGRTREF